MRRAATAFFVLFSAATAHAFCRETTVEIPPTFSGPGCWSEGLPVYWSHACVGYSVQQDASKQVSVAQAQQMMDSAFAAWSAMTCPTGGNPSIGVRFLGDVSCHKTEYNQTAGNANILMFDDESWPYADAIGAETLALTHITYNLDTGELYDADIEVNTAQNTFSLDGTGSNPDLVAALTHEAGHFLGLAHSLDTNATMYSHYEGSSMRLPGADDVNGICAIYAPDGTRATADGGLHADSCDPTPRHGYATGCEGAGASGCTCSSAPGRREGSAAASIAIGALLLLRTQRRRRGSVS